MNRLSRFNTINCGRRFGKTTLGIDRCADPAVLRYPVGWFSPTYKMLLEVWREAIRTFAPITIRRSVQDHRIEFVTGGLLEFWSLDNPDSARGRKYKRIIVDEAAMVTNLMDTWNYSLRPTLVDYGGDAFFLSTPKGHNGFWQMYNWGQDRQMTEWASWKMPTIANPFIPPSEVEAMRASMPERVYAQEILADFVEDGAGVFRRVREAATSTVLDAALPAHEYIFGVDWGKSNDFTVFTVLDIGTREVVHIDRSNQIDYALQTKRLRALYERFRPTVIVVEKNSMGEPLIEQLIRDDLPVQPFTTTNATKAQIIDALALGFERGEIKIPADPVLIGELQSYEMERLPSGMMRYGAPSGMHDDCVMSLAIAWHSSMTTAGMEFA